MLFFEIDDARCKNCPTPGAKPEARSKLAAKWLSASTLGDLLRVGSHQYSALVFNRFVLIGAILGAYFGGLDRWHLGIVGGAFVGAVLAAAQAKTEALRAQLAEISKKVEGLERSGYAMGQRLVVLEEAREEETGSRGVEASRAESFVVGPQVAESSDAARRLEASLDVEPLPSTSSGAPVSEASSAPSHLEQTGGQGARAASLEDASAQGNRTPDWTERAFAGLKEIVFGGNTVVRVGIFVLLVGVTLLLKFAAENSQLPLELRMSAGGAMGLSLVLLGLRLRTKRKVFSETLQGGGVATMFLVVFFSYRVYDLLPSSLAFALLVAIAGLGCVLAVVQNALSLILIGQVGGFLAPILASSGEGNHVALFSYYLLLNLAVAGVAWFRAWRSLNLIGFVFTFGIGAAWGLANYRPEHFFSTEPFLVAFYVLYVIVPVLFCLRGSAKGWVDGSLVFGAPLAFIGLQLALVRDMPFAMAWTTLLMAGMYLGLVRFLRRPAFVAFATMRSSFLALAIGFVTLAIPYGLDDAQLSSATWAIEGAGLYYLGVKQGRTFSRFCAVVLQILAGGALLVYSQSAPDADVLPFLHGRVLAGFFLFLGCLFIAHHAHQHRKQLSGAEAGGLQALIVWGILFIGFTLDTEFERVVPSAWLPGVQIASLGILGLSLEQLGARRQWPWVRYAPAALGLLLLPLAIGWVTADKGVLLDRGGVLAWPLYFASLYFTLRHFVPTVRERLAFLHVALLWSGCLWLGLLIFGTLEGPAQLGAPWTWTGFTVPTIFALWLLVVRQETLSWPLQSERRLYLGVGRLGLVVMVLSGAMLMNLLSSGSDDVLGYVPLLNPGELMQAASFLTFFYWWRSETRRPYLGSEEISGGLSKVALILLFLAWNGMLARSMHRYLGVRWSLDDLWALGPLQVAFAVSWAVIGLLVTTLSSRHQKRQSWLVGAALLGAVVVKLFALDLANLSAVPKIGTFLAVGVLLLLVGYFSPVPPAADRQAHADPDKGSSS